MKQIVAAGTTSKMMTVFIQSSTSTTGAGLTGLTYASAGLEWYWFAEDSTTSTTVTLATMTLGTWATGGFVQVDPTNLPGFYEIGIPNAVLANTNSRTWVTMLLQGAAGMVPVPIEIELGVQANVTQWLGTAVTSSSGIPIVVTTGTVTASIVGGVNVTQWNSTNVATPNIGGVPLVDVGDWTGVAVSTLSGLPLVYSSNAGTGGGSTNVNVVEWLGTAVTSNAGIPVVYTTNTVTSIVASGTVTTVSGNVVGSVASVVGTVTATVPSLSTNVNVQEWLGTAVTSAAGTPVVSVSKWLGTAVTSNAGIPQVYADGGTINTVTGTVTATVPGGGSTNVNVVQWNGTNVAVPNIGGVPVVDVVDWLGTAVTSNTGVPLVDVVGLTGTVTAVVVGGTIATVTNPVTLATGQLTVKRDQALAGFTFPMYDATSGNPATGLSVSCSISIDGATLAGSTNAPTEVGSGIYKLNLAAADLNGTVITLVFVASAASATIVTLITQA